MVRFAPFFFFFFFEFRPKSGRFGRYRPISADTGRYLPIRTDFGRVGADFSRVGPRRPDSGLATWHGRVVCGVPPASPRPAASDAGALAWEPRPCIPDIKPILSFCWVPIAKLFAYPPQLAYERPMLLCGLRTRKLRLH